MPRRRHFGSRPIYKPLCYWCCSASLIRRRNKSGIGGQAKIRLDIYQLYIIVCIYHRPPSGSPRLRGREEIIISMELRPAFAGVLHLALTEARGKRTPVRIRQSSRIFPSRNRPKS